MEVSPKQVFAKYKDLIDELIPYQLIGRLTAELDSLASAMPLIERKLVENEVKRLCQPCRKHLDLTKHSNLPAKSYVFSGCEILLCPIGKQLFEDQLKRFKGKYTQGVYEAATSPKLFQKYLTEYRQEKVKEAFTLPTERLADKVDPAKLKLAPNIQLKLPTLKKGGKPVTAQCYYLTPVSLVLESNEKLASANGDVCQIEYPVVAGLTEKPVSVSYKQHQAVFDERRESFLTRFAILRRELQWAKKIQSFMEQKGHELPAILPQETKRTGMDLAKAQLLAVSDWVPIFCSLTPRMLTPLSLLQTPGNTETITHLSLNDEFSFCPSWLPRITQYLLKNGECDLLWLRRDGNTYVATLDEAKEAGQLNAFMNAESIRGDLQFLKCRLIELKREELASAANELRGGRGLNPSINSILYVKDMAKLARKLVMDSTEKFPAPSDDFLQLYDTGLPVQLLVSKQQERRQETRYSFNYPVTLRAHFIRKFTGQLLDVSTGGMKVKLDKPLKSSLLRNVRADIQSFNLRKLKRSGIKFRVLGYLPEKRWLRLQVMPKHQKIYADHIEKLFQSNQKAFEQRDIQAQYREQYDALSLLAGQRHPGVHIRLKQGRIETRRLTQVLLGDLFSDASLLQSGDSNNIMLHEVFADKDAEFPSSSILSELFSSNSGELLCLFQCDPQTKTLTRLQPELLKNHRHKLLASLDEGAIQLVTLWLNINDVDALDPESISDILRRLAKLGATPLALAKKELMSVKHNLSITDVSPLFIELLRKGHWPG